MSMRRYIDLINEASRDPMDNPKFRRWFAGSKCVDATGKPLLVYHGTESDFKLYSNWPIVFTPDARVASAYALQGAISTERSVPNVRAAYLRVLQPRVFNEQSLSLLIDTADGERQWDVLDHYADIWQKNGADGIYLKNVIDYIGPGEQPGSSARMGRYDQWFVFDRSQIWPVWSDSPLPSYNAEPESADPEPHDKY